MLCPEMLGRRVGSFFEILLIVLTIGSRMGRCRISIAYGCYMQATCHNLSICYLYDIEQSLYDSEHIINIEGLKMGIEQGHILVVDDDEDILMASRLLLRRQFAEVVVCNKLEQIPNHLAANQFDAVLLDMNFGPGESSGAQGLEWLQRILVIDPNLVVVMITAHGSVDTVVEAMKLGATDFVAKPWQNEKVVATLSAAVELHQRRVEANTLKQTNQTLVEAITRPGDQIIGTSGAMNEVLSLVSRAAPTDANVLILGENGTGKELIAREIHRQSTRSDKVFISIDLGAVSETLFESELFGHKKGAFTGASKDRPGRFQIADGGTLFLDEIGNLALHLQTKLLSALAQRVVTPVGSDRGQQVDVRVICATNVPRTELADENRFRQDLLFRLNTVEITLPPLRDRRTDIFPIATHYAALYAKKYGKPEKRFTESAREALEAYTWPGNVRALRHAIERAVILSVHNEFEPSDLQLNPLSSVAPAMVGNPPQLNLEQLEKTTIEEALRKHAFNISKASRELGLTRASLYRRMEKHDL
jgi:DNA-binding NtrC family response regulator